ncbi:hypothetical protein A3752_08175 [Oleiphilus sp. HI0081]|jgi:demethylmenaquinone methyltransferase/2-methoxy-6-polyprenyl-1,4-benzoquinol methylase|uniref:class I SAM-dependent methyltransferase n=3 Tax=Oleiphilus TaxID=141450 RepID=UPI0007C251C3|nr:MULTISPECIES: methyltransferase domain-containing protein [unclassified Oleiphilus]KZY41012.1 hypothetical protein A3732_03270 [Oleiphilus sp. HI0050]KZY81807.1 hypothetical protein A3741_17120 [Oleiphilus sp. HI0069]KZY88472.1 hypothetical protein A3743_11690 [Oleiphilus sp. HI0072]KZZ06738.1 hypothetical protein A3749_16665 [Oleiphilus sp. HI0078]KZZ21760.1 hypothetical protein A3752_08175 [Oleiphilus sp. HI0081]
MSEDNSFVRGRYDRTARFYEKAAHLYSGGKIIASKRWQLRDIKPGDKLLFVGAGSGEDVVLAAQKGAEITVVELSPKMLKRIECKLERLSLNDRVVLVLGDAFKHLKDSYYDYVVANYFLNVFAHPLMIEMLNHLSLQLKPGGSLMVADFAPISGNLVQRLCQRLYYYSALFAFHLIAKNPVHKIYDYTLYAKQANLSVKRYQMFKVLPGQSDWYRSLELVRK